MPSERLRVEPERPWVGCVPSDKGAHFRVWAPERRKIELVFDDGAIAPLALEPRDDGYFEARVPNAKSGMRYRYRLDDEPALYPDPASRFQPDGPHGSSEIIDPRTFEWTDDAWTGRGAHGHVVYEMHVGTFTGQGTWEAAIEQLPELARLGITTIEVMPVADFGGNFGWGYDGVDFFAPTRLYGRPDDFRRFVDAAHAHGLGVILDVVYNHFGPDGNFATVFARDYLDDQRQTDWGKAVNFSGKNSSGVRDFVVANAAYWIRDFHLDGLRVDATQDIIDDSPVHILREIVDAARRAAAPRTVFIVGENEPQRASLLLPSSEGGCGFDALWNDDFHHSAMVALTGKAEAYYTDYRGTAQEFISLAKRGYLFQGQRYAWQKNPRGEPSLGVHPQAFVAFLENHDQVANTGAGRRTHERASPGTHRALVALTLLGPATPMLFQGQEFASSAPFYYFADHEPDLAALVAKGRRDFLAQFPSLANAASQRRLRDPADRATFIDCKLDFSERTTHADAYALHRDLLALRKGDPVFARPTLGCLDGAVLADDLFVLRFFGGAEGDRLVIVNLGRDRAFSSIAEPLVAPSQEGPWTVLWSSDDVVYGGEGVAPFDRGDGLYIAGQCTVVLTTSKATST